MTITLNGTTGITTPDVTSDGLTVDSTTLVVDEANNRVGIGTGSPNFPLTIVKTITDQSSFWSDSTPTFTSNFGNVWSNYQTATSTHVAAIKLNSASSSTGYLTFHTNGATERARIDSSGNLLVGTTSAGGTGGWTFYPTGSGGSPYVIINKANTGSTRAFDFMVSGTSAGSINWTNTATSYLTSSDYRLKEDWQPMTGASERVKALKPVNFAWKVDGSRVDGFLAHEAQAVVPEAVTGEKDAVELVDIKDEQGNVTGQEERPVYQGIDQSKLVPLLTAALQEALAEIETLKARVSALEATNV